MSPAHLQVCTRNLRLPGLGTVYAFTISGCSLASRAVSSCVPSLLRLKLTSPFSNTALLESPMRC